MQAAGGKDEDTDGGFAAAKGKRAFPDRLDAKFELASATPYPTGVVGLDYGKA